MISEMLLSLMMVRSYQLKFSDVCQKGATILKQLEVLHPAAKVIVQLSQLQDTEVGDGTTSVVILASELLKVNNLSLEKISINTDISPLES